MIISNSDHIAQSGLLRVINELERMWKEAILEKLKIISQHILGGTEKNYD
jgi:hypothetical protein